MLKVLPIVLLSILISTSVLAEASFKEEKVGNTTIITFYERQKFPMNDYLIYVYERFGPPGDFYNQRVDDKDALYSFQKYDVKVFWSSIGVYKIVVTMRK